MNVVGKKLLVLGGTVASLNIVNLAKAMGIYTCLLYTSYNNDTAKKFHSFKTLLLAMSGVETLGLILFLTFAIGPVYGKYYTLLFAALNIIPVLVNGLFTYINQATMRFKQYAIGNTLDKLLSLIHI